MPLYADDIHGSMKEAKSRFDCRAVPVNGQNSPGLGPQYADVVNMTGAVKHDQGKSPVMRGCLQYFPRALKAVADVSQFGYEKYKSWGGWRHVEDGLARYTDGLGRHLLAETIEGDYDPESHLLHAAHACWNACARLEKLLEDGVPMKDPALTTEK